MTDRSNRPRHRSALAVAGRTVLVLLAALLLFPALAPAAPPPAAVDPGVPMPDFPARTRLAPPDEATVAAFAEAVDLPELGTLAVFHGGRLKSFESFAAQMMQFVTGPERIDDRPSTFTFLDLLARPEAYEGRDIIYVKKKPIRARIVGAFTGQWADGMPVDPRIEARLDAFMETGLIGRDILRQQVVAELLHVLSQDLMRTAEAVERIEDGLVVSEPGVLLQSLAIVPPAGGTLDDPWASAMELMRHPAYQSELETLARASQSMEPGDRRTELERFVLWSSLLVPPDEAPGRLPDDDAHAAVAGHWQDLLLGWRTLDAEAVNEAVADLQGGLRSINAAVYPSDQRLAWEGWYFRSYNMVWIWIVYGLACVPLMLHVIFRWRGARILGLVTFGIAFALQTFAIGLRWYVADRWPNSNMFEAVTTSAWFGGCGAIMLELLVRRSAMQTVFLLGSSVASMVALMCAYYMPLSLNPNISNMMPVLHDVWLYIHTNVIIFSYCLIFMAAVTATLYLLYRFLGKFLSFGQGTLEYARGGAGTIIEGRGPGASVTNTEGDRGGGLGSPTSFGQIMDGTTMVLMELSFVTLWAGLVMGAIWADHSWGRPWGWDPKEVFALNTFIVFAILVHVRLQVKDKGLWTAVLALIGAGVMLFNWIVINFHIVGLHSYA